MKTTMPLPAFAQTHKQIMTHARADALSCIHRAQDAVHEALLVRGIGATVLHLVRADITETLLVKAASLLVTTPQYADLRNVRARESFLDAYLTLSLLTWLADRAEPVERSRIASTSAQMLAPAR